MSPEQNVHYLFDKSKFIKREKLKLKEITSNPSFKREYKFLNINFPIYEGPINDEYINKFDPERSHQGDVLWKSFLNKWGIEKIRKGKLHLKREIRVGTKKDKDNKFHAYLEIDSPDVSQQDIMDHLPLLIYVKNEHLGKMKNTQGRKKDNSILKRKLAVKKAYKALFKTKEYLNQEIYNELARKYHCSSHTIKRYVLSV